MCDTSRDIAAKKIAEMPAEQVLKLLLFMAGMETANPSRPQEHKSELDDFQK